MDIEKYRDNPKTVYLFKEYDRLVAEISDTQKMLEVDPSMKDLVAEEFTNLETNRNTLAKTIEDIAKADVEENQFDANEIILEVRAGAGGEEAAIFAYDLAQMYEKYAVVRADLFASGCIEAKWEGIKRLSKLKRECLWDT